MPLMRGADAAHGPSVAEPPGVSRIDPVKEPMPHGRYFFPGVLAQGEEAFAAMRSFLARTPRVRP